MLIHQTIAGVRLHIYRDIHASVYVYTYILDHTKENFNTFLSKMQEHIYSLSYLNLYLCCNCGPKVEVKTIFLVILVIKQHFDQVISFLVK